MKTQAEFLCCSLEENSFFRKPQSLLLRPLTDRTMPTHIREDNLLYAESTDIIVNNIPRIPSQQNLGWCLTKQTPNLAPSPSQVDT